MPHNATTGARYRGINTLVLGMSPLAFMTCDPRWATYKQATDRGWQVRKGSRGTPGFFYKKIEVGDREGWDDGRKVIPLLRSFTLFHASQIEGILPYIAPGVEEAPWREPEAPAAIARNSRAVIRVGGDRAFFSPATDHVQMPPTSAFRSPAAYASVLLHELGQPCQNSRVERSSRKLRHSPRPSPSPSARFCPKSCRRCWPPSQ
jgi:antirestriction protein ArdC